MLLLLLHGLSTSGSILDYVLTVYFVPDQGQITNIQHPNSSFSRWCIQRGGRSKEQPICFWYPVASQTLLILSLWFSTFNYFFNLLLAFWFSSLGLSKANTPQLHPAISNRHGCVTVLQERIDACMPRDDEKHWCTVVRGRKC